MYSVDARTEASHYTGSYTKNNYTAVMSSAKSRCVMCCATYRHFNATDEFHLAHPICSDCRNDTVKCLSSAKPATAGVCRWCVDKKAPKDVVHTIHQATYKGRPTAFAYCIECAHRNIGSNANALTDIVDSIKEAMSTSKQADIDKSAQMASGADRTWWERNSNNE